MSFVLVIIVRGVRVAVVFRLAPIKFTTLFTATVIKAFRRFVTAVVAFDLSHDYLINKIAPFLIQARAYHAVTQKRQPVLDTFLWADSVSLRSLQDTQVVQWV